MTRRRRLTLVAMCIAQGMTLLDVTIVNTALPSIQRELHMTAGQLEWVISAYALSLAAFIPLGGALGDRFGRKRFFLAGMVVFTLGSVACALSTSDVALIGSRALQGAGGAFMSALTLAILTETYPVERRAGAFGMWAAISGLGFGLGPVVGGALLSVFSWSSVFWVNVPFAVAGFVIAYRGRDRVAQPGGPRTRRGRDGRHRPRTPRRHLRAHRVVQSPVGVARRRWSAGSWAWSWWCSSSCGRAGRRHPCCRRACCGPAASSRGVASTCSPTWHWPGSCSTSRCSSRTSRVGRPCAPACRGCP